MAITARAADYAVNELKRGSFLNESTDRKKTLLWRRAANLRVSAMLGGVALGCQASMPAGCGGEEAEVLPQYVETPGRYDPCTPCSPGE